MTLRSIAPPGYDSKFDLLLDVIRFGGAIFGRENAWALLNHIERSTVYSKASDTHSIAQMTWRGVYDDKHQEWTRAHAGISRNTFLRANKALTAAGVLRKERRYKGNADAPSEFEVDTQAIKDLIDAWKRDNARPDRLPLFTHHDETEPPDGGGGRVENPVENHATLSLTGTPPVPHRDTQATASLAIAVGATTADHQLTGDPVPHRDTPPVPHRDTQASFSLPSVFTSKLDTPAVEQGGFALPSMGAAPPNPRPPIAGSGTEDRRKPKTPPLEAGKHEVLQNLANQVRASYIREIIRIELGFTLGPRSTIPGRLVDICEKVGIPDKAAALWMHEWVIEKKLRHYEILGPELLITAAQTNLIAWGKRPLNAAYIAECQREEEIRAEREAAAAPVLQMQLPRDMCPRCGQEVADGHEQHCAAGTEREQRVQQAGG